MNNQEVAISVKNVSKSFKLPHEQSNGLKQAIINVFRKDKKRGYETQHVLNDVSFDIKKGEFFGIVGRNGSGKSTLLKLISQIYVPNEGSIEVNGSLTPFIELGVGFNPELTGRENVYMNGALMGFSNKQMDMLYNDIVEFAELERFMDQKLKNYSSGMQVRLAFSIAIRAKSDILILDEVLAVGDEAFQRKCNNYFQSIKKDKTKTVVLVTHGMEAVKKYCDRALLIKDGRVMLDGSPDEVANKYSLENLESTKSTSVDAYDAKMSIIKDLRVELMSRKQINQEENVIVQVSYCTTKSVPTKVALNLYDVDRRTPVLGSVSQINDKKKVKLIFTTKLSELNDTNFIVRSTVRSKDGDILDYVSEDVSPTFTLRRTDYGKYENKSTFSLLKSKGEWR
jgi:ABC-2 type transport system ATP-binding protein